MQRHDAVFFSLYKPQPLVRRQVRGQIFFSQLSEREEAVLRLMVRGMSSREIAGALFITESTVKFRVTHILGKLNAEDRTQAVITALKRGLASLQ